MRTSFKQSLNVTELFDHIVNIIYTFTWEYYLISSKASNYLVITVSTLKAPSGMTRLVGRKPVLLYISTKLPTITFPVRPREGSVDIR